MSSVLTGAALPCLGEAREIQTIIIDQQEAEAAKELIQSFAVIEDIVNDIPPPTQQDA